MLIYSLHSPPFSCQLEMFSQLLLTHGVLKWTKKVSYVFKTNLNKFKFRELVSRIFWGIFYIEPDLCKVDFCCKADPHLSLTIVFVTKDVGTRNRDSHSCPLLLRFKGRAELRSCRVVLDALKFPLVFNLLQQQIKCRMTGSFSKKMWHVIQ